MRFARWTFGLAALWGIIVVGPLYFLENQMLIEKHLNGLPKNRELINELVRKAA